MLPPVVTSETKTLTIVDYKYTIGSGGDWDTVRPLKVIDCYLRDSDGTDYPVKIMSSIDYNRISDKNASARPTGLYFLPEYPLAKIIFDAVPNYAYNAYFEFLKNFTEFATTATSVTLPEEYKEALVYNLAVSLGEDWDRVVGKTVYAQAMRTREVIDRLRASNQPIPEARFDDMLQGNYCSDIKNDG